MTLIADGVLVSARLLNRSRLNIRTQCTPKVLSGGMILPDKPYPIIHTAPYIQKAYKNVEDRTGTKFGEDYLWHIFNPEESDWFRIR
jgi:protein-disulfide isomerase-like protein with CxxC motif